MMAISFSSAEAVNVEDEWDGSTSGGKAAAALTNPLPNTHQKHNPQIITTGICHFLPITLTFSFKLAGLKGSQCSAPALFVCAHGFSTWNKTQIKTESMGARRSVPGENLKVFFPLPLLLDLSSR
jgi:hypothetical protein